MSPNGPRILPVRNPYTGEFDYEITPPTPEELAQTCTRLRAAQVTWGAAPLEHRIEVLSRWADELDAAYGPLSAADYADTGGCLISLIAPRVVAGSVRAWAADAPRVLAAAARSGTSSIMPSISFRTQLVPYPLVGVISPWNGPLMLSMLDPVPALFAGSAVIVKPSEVAPRFTEPLMATIRAVPELAGVLTFITGDAQTGQELIGQVDMLCFTGSVPNGRKVAQACAARLIPAYLELGGKDPAVITASADLEAAATAVLRGAAFGTGQVCFSIERIYVQEDVHDEFVDILARKAGQVKLNYPDIDDGEIGPFGFDRQAKIADEHLADAVAKGAVIRAGGPSQELGGGHYMRPTVLTEVNHGMLLMREESFAPFMPVMRYRTEDEAVELANDTSYGLSAAVIAGTAAEAARIGERINAGTVSLQDTFLTLFKTRDIGTNSFGDSGLGGDRTGPASILRFLRKKALLTQSAPPAPLARPATPAAPGGRP
ncbi:aldehyde dehydrogenase family protein [Trebonia sp.]|uniref:aldehyde dehydrogenase family protein n=1 Tax=Trebonia sp. TaxID=2767075 RepID=UPI002628C68B|nr:aldehyde dehydrogenase family protein [Trebonia sp.]